MAEKPILFNTEMVRAILDGKKKQTRRIIKPQPKWQSETKLWQWENIAWPEGANPKIPFHQKQNNFLYGPEDILYVRETFYPGEYDILYRASLSDLNKEIFKKNNHNWKPSIHMPKEAARIFLEVTDVRVERLQEIGEIGVYKEGFESIGHFEDAWLDIYEDKYKWDENPWVWVIEFEVDGIEGSD